MNVFKTAGITLMMLMFIGCASNSSHEERSSSSKKPVATATDNYEYAKKAQKAGNSRTAIEYNTRAIELNPYYYDAYANRGALYYERGEYQKAFKDFSYVLQHKNDFECYFNRGKIYYSWEQYSEAISDFTNATCLNPKDSDSYTMLGNCYAQRKQYTDAINCYKKALDINPSDMQAYSNLKALQGR